MSKYKLTFKQQLNISPLENIVNILLFYVIPILWIVSVFGLILGCMFSIYIQLIALILLIIVQLSSHFKERIIQHFPRLDYHPDIAKVIMDGHKRD